MQLCESFDLLIEATEHEQKYLSQADDSSTSTRRVQFILTRVLNKLNDLIEISDTQAVAGLMRFDAGQCSEIFWVYDSRSMENFMIDEKWPRAEEEAVSERSEEESLCDSNSLHDFLLRVRNKIGEKIVLSSPTNKFVTFQLKTAENRCKKGS